MSKKVSKVEEIKVEEVVNDAQTEQPVKIGVFGKVKKVIKDNKNLLVVFGSVLAASAIGYTTGYRNGRKQAAELYIKYEDEEGIESDLVEDSVDIDTIEHEDEEV